MNSLDESCESPLKCCVGGCTIGGVMYGSSWLADTRPAIADAAAMFSWLTAAPPPPPNKLSLEPRRDEPSSPDCDDDVAAAPLWCVALSTLSDAVLVCPFGAAEATPFVAAAEAAALVEAAAVEDDDDADVAEAVTWAYGCSAVRSLSYAWLVIDLTRAYGELTSSAWLMELCCEMLASLRM